MGRKVGIEVDGVADVVGKTGPAVVTTLADGNMETIPVYTIN